MQRLSIRHETRYFYEQPVGFGAHKLLVRPRDGHSLRLIDASLELSQPGPLRWIYDALGNCVCEYEPQGQADYLSITSNLCLARYPASVEVKIDDPKSAFPITYSLTDRVALEPMILPTTEDADGVVAAWLRGFMGAPGEPVLFFLQRLNTAIKETFTYGERYAEGVQTPTETVNYRAGTCRDFAWLMVEALRSVGFAARFVTGYLYSPNAEFRGCSATHAWCEVFLPRLGWTEFDPTNGLIESADLIPIAVARTPAEAAPISGSLIGFPGFSRMEVDVHVRPAIEEETRLAAA